MYEHIQVPTEGQKITLRPDGTLIVPDQPIIPFIEGDGVGIDTTPVMIKVVDAAVQHAYSGRRQIHWMEIYAGEKATRLYGPDVWLPDETAQAIQDYVVSIKGPLTTPVGGGIRSLNVTLRQELDLYVCLRPVRYFKGVPSPLKEPERTDMVIFRENSEDIYAGIEWPAGSEEARKLIRFLSEELGSRRIRFPETSGLGVKPVSREGTERLVRKAIQYAIDNDRPNVTLVHKGNIMKFTEGAFQRPVQRPFPRLYPVDVGQADLGIRLRVSPLTQPACHPSGHCKLARIDLCQFVQPLCMHGAPLEAEPQEDLRWITTPLRHLSACSHFDALPEQGRSLPQHLVRLHQPQHCHHQAPQAQDPGQIQRQVMQCGGRGGAKPSRHPGQPGQTLVGGSPGHLVGAQQHGWISLQQASVRCLRYLADSNSPGTENPSSIRCAVGASPAAASSMPASRSARRMAAGWGPLPLSADSGTNSGDCVCGSRARASHCGFMAGEARATARAPRMAGFSRSGESRIQVGSGGDGTPSDVGAALSSSKVSCSVGEVGIAEAVACANSSSALESGGVAAGAGANASIGLRGTAIAAAGAERVHNSSASGIAGAESVPSPTWPGWRSLSASSAPRPPGGRIDQSSDPSGRGSTAPERSNTSAASFAPLGRSIRPLAVSRRSTSSPPPGQTT
jgi:hypothetical protein